MKKLASKRAFTLIELLVAMSIIGIILTGVSTLNFSRIWNQQKLETFTNKIISNIETVRNNALIWKWTTSDLDIPPAWRVIIPAWTDTEVEVSYSWATWSPLVEYNININNDFQIQDLQCSNLSQTNTGAITWNWEIIITWAELYIPTSICPLPNNQLLQFTTSYKWLSRQVSINTVSWLIEIKK